MCAVCGYALNMLKIEKTNVNLLYGGEINNNNRLESKTGFYCALCHLRLTIFVHLRLQLL